MRTNRQLFNFHYFIFFILFGLLIIIIILSKSTLIFCDVFGEIFIAFYNYIAPNIVTILVIIILLILISIYYFMIKSKVDKKFKILRSVLYLEIIILSILIKIDIDKIKLTNEYGYNLIKHLDSDTLLSDNINDLNNLSLPYYLDDKEILSQFKLQKTKGHLKSEFDLLLNYNKYPCVTLYYNKNSKAFEIID